MKRILLVMIAISMMVLAVACTQRLTGSPPLEVGSGSNATPQPVEKVLSVFSPIEGTNYLMARISADPQSRERSSNPLTWIESGYSSSSYDTYNFVFFDLDTETYHRLLPTNETVILQITGFPVTPYDPSNPDQPSLPIEWWLYTMVKRDTDQNGRLDYEDNQTLGVSDVGGNGNTDVIADVDNVLGSIYKNGTLFVIYNSGAKNFIAKIDLPARAIVSTAEMDLGEDVK